MLISDVIREADARIANSFTELQKLNWLNEINREFFEIVKIPKTFTETTLGSTYAVPSDMREKNIRKVIAGSTYYRSIVYDNISAAFNHYTLSESSRVLQLFPSPLASVPLVVVYDRTPAKDYVTVGATTEVEAPLEYHWLYVLALCAKIAKTMSDVSLANNYESEYKNGLAVAQQNYQRGVIE